MSIFIRILNLEPGKKLLHFWTMCRWWLRVSGGQPACVTTAPTCLWHPLYTRSSGVGSSCSAPPARRRQEACKWLILLLLFTEVLLLGCKINALENVSNMIYKLISKLYYSRVEFTTVSVLKYTSTSAKLFSIKDVRNNGSMSFVLYIL